MIVVHPCPRNQGNEYPCLKETKKETENWIPILKMRKASMLIKPLGFLANKTNRGSLTFQIHDYIKEKKEKST